ncbi:hypothetical protein H5410_010796 [Solanum commersonii]|uniref:Uncharacterized protein n=1 Tax=Solanum commersonii TaxID=4109 RepID=A0A9J6AN73_SOLCO|nr:hypothetical protein H5410_010796 [Solanum commersonii]
MAMAYSYFSLPFGCLLLSKQKKKKTLVLQSHKDVWVYYRSMIKNKVIGDYWVEMVRICEEEVLGCASEEVQEVKDFINYNKLTQLSIKEGILTPIVYLKRNKL